MFRSLLSVRRFALSILILGLLPSFAAAQQDSKASEKTGTADQAAPVKVDQTEDQSGDPLKRPITDKRRKENRKSFKHELSREDKDWLEKDVRWIITDDERKAFMQLSNEEEREKFIEAFWDRRNPDPDSEDNAFKDEHYRRIEYANEHFPAGMPGWMTDRGRIYIVYGPPDEIESHPSGGTYQRPMEEGGGETSTYPFEDWRYRHIDNIGEEVIIEFVDDCMCGAYEMTMDRSKKDALLMVPGAGLTLYEQMGMASKTDRFTGGNGLERIGTGPGGATMQQSKEFDRLEQFAKINAAPAVKFKDLEEVVRTHISYNLMPFDVRTDFIRITNDTILVPVTVQIKNRDITFANKDGVQHGVVNIFGRLTSLTGKVMQTFEDTVQADVPAELLPKEVENSKVYWKAVPLRPGLYRLDLVIKDVQSGNVGVVNTRLAVHQYEDAKLDSSSLIVADQIEHVPAKQIGAGQFVLGSSKVRPRMEADFTTADKLGIYMQVYNLKADDNTHKSSAAFQYTVKKGDQQVMQFKETSADMKQAGDQVTIERLLPLATLAPGKYMLEINATDTITNQTITRTAEFTVKVPAASPVKSAANTAPGR